ncbi:MAG: exonuclease domain-containing protein [Burkholderiaceae bacterium]
MRLAFVDLETTGGSPVEDRITEVGIIEVDLDDPALPVREWSALVNPDAPIPPFIQTLTGITDAMVADAPRFEEVAADILTRLDGRLFIAHNARFDHGFLKNAFRRMGHPFRPPVLCTMRLSRKLYPGYSRHNLDTLIERHRLVVDMRHRALGDARLLWQLWQKLHDALPADQIGAAIDQLTARPSLPRHLDPDVLDTLPKTAGVYLFHGEPTEEERADMESGRVEEPRPLYIGKAKNLRQRVMAHFTGDHLSAREMEISQQMTRIEWIETGGGTQHDLGALLTEATFVKQRMPAYNRQLRRSDDVCAWRLVVDRSRGRWKLAIARPDDLFFAQDRDLYGPFASPRQAGVTLRAIADAYGLCPALLKLDKAHAGKPCFAYQVKRCRGACIGLETVAEHTERLQQALASMAVVPWPFDGAIAFREGRSFHALNGWAYLGMTTHLDAARQLAVTTRLFDHDVYRLLVGRIGAMEVVRLDDL